MTEQGPSWRCGVGGLAVVERPVKLSVLRIRGPSRAVTDALGAAFELVWPTEPNTVAWASARVAWLSHAEWGVFASAEGIRTQVSAACGDHNHLLTDVSAARRLWRIEGANARMVIAKACGLDTHPRVLPPGRCAQSLFAGIDALLIPLSGALAFDVVADASLQGHLRVWFSDALREFK